MTVEALLAPLEMPHTPFSDAADLRAALDAGVIDQASYDEYQKPHDHFVEVTVRRAGKIVQQRLSPNLRNNAGGDWQAIAMGGDVAFGDNGTASASGAATLTDGSKSWTTNQWLHHIVAVGPNASGTGSTVFGMILSNTATVLTVDRWYTSAAAIGGAAGTTPNATSKYQILGANMPLRFIALSADAGAPATTDTALASELSTNGLGRAEATYAHTAVSGGTTTTVTTTYTLAKTFTATGTQTGIQKCGVFYSVVGATGTAMFENTFSPVNVISGDQLTVTWTVNA